MPPDPTRQGYCPAQRWNTRNWAPNLGSLHKRPWRRGAPALVNQPWETRPQDGASPALQGKRRRAEDGYGGTLKAEHVSDFLAQLSSAPRAHSAGASVLSDALVIAAHTDALRLWPNPSMLQHMLVPIAQLRTAAIPKLQITWRTCMASSYTFDSIDLCFNVYNTSLLTLHCLKCASAPQFSAEDRLCQRGYA